MKKIVSLISTCLFLLFCVSVTIAAEEQYSQQQLVAGPLAYDCHRSGIVYKTYGVRVKAEPSNVNSILPFPGEWKGNPGQYEGVIILNNTDIVVDTDTDTVQWLIRMSHIHQGYGGWSGFVVKKVVINPCQ